MSLEAIVGYCSGRFPTRRGIGESAGLANDRPIHMTPLHRSIRGVLQSEVEGDQGNYESDGNHRTHNCPQEK